MSSKPNLTNFTLMSLLVLLNSVTAYLSPASQNHTVMFVLPSTSLLEIPGIGVPLPPAAPPAAPPPVVPSPSLEKPAHAARPRPPTAAPAFRKRRRLSPFGINDSSM